MAHRIDTSASSPAGPLPPASGAAWLRRLPLVSGLTTALLGLAALEAYVFGNGPDVSSPLLLPQTVPLVALLFVLAALSLLSLLARLNRHLDRVPVLSEVREMTIICPGCQKKQTVGVGDSACSTCGLKFHIRVEEPRCPNCDYVLFMLQSDRCPECGTPVRGGAGQESRASAPAI